MTTTPPTVDAARALLINRRVKNIRPLIPPQILQEDISMYVLPKQDLYSAIGAICVVKGHGGLTVSLFLVSTIEAAKAVLQGRHDTERIVRGEDDRLIVVVGFVH